MRRAIQEIRDKRSPRRALWSNDSTLEIKVPSSYPTSESQSARPAEPERGELSYFSIAVALSRTCSCLGNDLSMHIGETEVLRMPIKDEEYEVAQFFPVWRQLSSKSAIGPHRVGKIKLKIRFEVEKAAVPVAPSLVVPSSSSQSGVVAPERPSFLPVNFADALNTKRKQLKAAVAPESVPDAAHRSRGSPEFDAAASERILKEIAADPTLRQIPAHLVQFLNPISEGVCDVGSAAHWRDQDPLLMEETGSSGYAAPEIFTNEGYSSKVDVWSFGIVLWELLHTGSTNNRSPEEATNNNASKTANPFVGIASDKFVQLARTGTRPICCFPSGDTHSQFEELLHKCWQFDPADRSTTSEVTAELHAITHSLPDQ